MIGAFRLNTLSAAMAAGAAYISATGGTTSIYSTGGKTYQVHTFTSSGTFTVASGSGTVDVLLVGGGGSGGRTGQYGMGGGGGAGQVQYLTAVTAATTSITIGTGGPASVADPLNGGATSAFGYTSAGGGAGGVNSNGDNGRSVTGGSGGGGGGSWTGSGSGGTGTYNGGNARTGNEAGGGGGGAGGAGQSAPSSGRGGAGGVGAAITDTFQSGTQYYGGGGGGGGGTTAQALGGSSIGGDGAFSPSGSAVNGGNAVANTGSGGGGGYANQVNTSRNIGGAGSAGIVRIRYEVAPGTRLQTSYSGEIFTASSYFGSSGLGYSTGQSGTRTFTMPAARGANATTIEFFAYKGTESGSTPNSIFQFGNILLQNRLNTSQQQWGIINNSSQTVASQTGNGTANAYNHICFQTTGNGTWTWWVNGYRTGTFSISVNTTEFTIGRLNLFSSGNFTIRFDEIRVSSVTRYTENTDLTVPTAPFVNDANTVALFHCESTTQLDDNAI